MMTFVLQIDDRNLVMTSVLQINYRLRQKSTSILQINDR